MPYPFLPSDNVAAAAAAYHSYSANLAAMQATESTAARSSAPSVAGSVVHTHHNHRAAPSHSSEGATYQQRPSRHDKEPVSRLSTTLPHAAWTARDRPQPSVETSEFTDYVYGRTAAPIHPLKQVTRTTELLRGIGVVASSLFL